MCETRDARNPVSDFIAQRAELADLDSVCAGLGAVDAFAFRRVEGERFVHLGGAGRGTGWAGIVDLVLSEEPAVAEAYRSGAPARVRHEVSGQIFGPYYAREAVVVPLSDDVLVVFGNPDGPVAANADHAELMAAATALSSGIEHVSPAKRLADELEVLHAVKAMLQHDPDSVPTAMQHIVTSATEALSCDLGVLYVAEGDRLAVAEAAWHIDAGQDEIIQSMRLLWSEQGLLPSCVQDAGQLRPPGVLGTRTGVLTYYAVPVGDPPEAILILMHTVARPRGFTSLCRDLGLRLAEAAHSVLATAVLREQLRAELERVRLDARMDELTGLGNRLAWEEALVDARARVHAGRPAAVLLADLNHLKAANDTYGHGFGDRLLVSFADVVRTSLRARDFVARIGGDEIAVLLPDTDEAAAAAVVAQLCAALDGHPGVDGFPLSAAIGWAVCPPESSLTAAQAAADASMYGHKARTRQPHPSVALER